VDGVAGRKSYNQNCPIARGLDVLGDRWTLLILRELLGGARRYGDVRAALPGIATNLLADRLRELEEAGLVVRSELPPPVARTVYTLSDEGWRKVPPVIRGVATFGLDLLEPSESALTPLNGFLAGILLGFDPTQVSDAASYSVDIDGRRFGFGVTTDGLTAAADPPAVTVTATAADLITARLGGTAAERKAALRRCTFEGSDAAIDAMRAAFRLVADPGLASANRG
jgi:DNA-binding HxlR family transcriptional regulator